jgi:hypothetical protein
MVLVAEELVAHYSDLNENNYDNESLVSGNSSDSENVVVANKYYLFGIHI